MVAEKHYVGGNGKSNIDTKGKSRYNEFESIAMQWANSADVEQGELKRLYSGKTNNWCLVIADKSFAGGYSVLVAGTYERVKNFERIYDKTDNGVYRDSEIFESTKRRSGSYSLFNGNRGNADRSIQQLEGRKLSTNSEGSNENLRTGNNEISTEAGSIESAFSNAEIDTDSNKNYIPADKFGQAIKDFTEGKITEEEFYETATKIDESRAKYLNTKYKNKYRNGEKALSPHTNLFYSLT